MEPRCSQRNCVHFAGVKSDGEEVSERVVCRAFPEGIPEDIAYGDNLHLEPVDGDHGIQFEQDPVTVDDEEEDLDDLDDVLHEDQDDILPDPDGKED